MCFAENALRSLLEALTSPPYAPMQHLEREQALAKQFAEILHFTLSFDELKVDSGFSFCWGRERGFRTQKEKKKRPVKNTALLSLFTDDKSSHPKRLQLLQEDHKPEQAEQPAGEASETTSTRTLLVFAHMARVKQHGFTFRTESFMRDDGRRSTEMRNCCCLLIGWD